MSKFCTNCGGIIEDNSQFCQNCGANVVPSASPNNNLGNMNINNNFNNTNVKSKTNVAAIMGFICSLVGLLFMGLPMGILAITLGIVGKQRAKVFNEGGNGFALVAIIIGTIDILAILFSVAITLITML